ncbi:MAG: hypothetical protein JSW73_03985 [Candidatus Woesearchaeota archaeon]|nr:MAG: hypothetical protein JSW73_03985 [Candidatus Woesearchaeota archaeon]
MNIKEVLKPTKNKILIFVVLNILIIAVQHFQLADIVYSKWNEGALIDYTSIQYGLPLVFMKYGFLNIASMVPLTGINFFNIFYLILDLIILYFVSCLIIHIYSKHRGGK